MAKPRGVCRPALVPVWMPLAVTREPGLKMSKGKSRRPCVSTVCALVVGGGKGEVSHEKLLDSAWSAEGLSASARAKSFLDDAWGESTARGESMARGESTASPSAALISRSVEPCFIGEW